MSAARDYSRPPVDRALSGHRRRASHQRRPPPGDVRTDRAPYFSRQASAHTKRSAAAINWQVIKDYVQAHMWFNLAALPVTGQANRDLLDEVRGVTAILGDVRIPEGAPQAATE